MRSFSRSFSCLPPCLALIASVASGQQQTAVPAPQILRDAMNLTGGSVQSLVLPFTEWQPFRVRVAFAGRTWTLDLQPYDMRAPGFKMLEVGAGGVREVPASLPTTYRGVVEGLPESIVAANLYRGQLNGLILLNEATWAIEPASEALPWLPRSAHVIYRNDEIGLQEYSCPVETVGQPHGGPGTNSLEAVTTADIAVELERRFINIRGGVGNAINQATAILNGVDAIYQRDTNITFHMGRLLIRDAGYSSNSTAVLGQFRNTWNARFGDIRRDLAHLFMGSSSSGIIGVASVATVCGPSAYSVSWHTSSLTTRTAVTAHELGHSFSALHCNGANPCRIMCSAIGGCSGNITSFGPVSINAITNFASTRNCLN